MELISLGVWGYECSAVPMTGCQHQPSWPSVAWWADWSRFPRLSPPSHELLAGSSGAWGQPAQHAEGIWRYLSLLPALNKQEREGNMPSWAKVFIWEVKQTTSNLKIHTACGGLCKTNRLRKIPSNFFCQEIWTWEHSSGSNGKGKKQIYKSS